MVFPEQYIEKSFEQKSRIYKLKNFRIEDL